MVLPSLLAAACVDAVPAEPTESRAAALTTAGLFYQGVNLTGAERGFGAEIEESWGPAIPGVDGSTYVWPNPDANTNVAVLDTALFPGGINTVRLPLQWERLQPTLGAAFDAGYLAKLKATAEALRKRGATVLLDVHNYAYYKLNNRGTAQPGQHLGSADVPTAAFVDLWKRLAQEFGSPSKSHPYVFGLMNEPHDLMVSVWVDAAQQALTAIRSTGAKNLVLVPGADWTTAADFSWSDNRNRLQSVTDPDDNMAVEVHQYYDDACVANGYVDKLKPFEDWAAANSRVAWLGEMDLTDSSAACQQAFASLLTHLKAKAAGTSGGVWIGYTYWAVDASSTTSGASFVTTPFISVRAQLPATCASGAKDGAESDVDCGGTCRRCADGKTCTKDTDCQSGYCVGNVCSKTGGAGGSGGGGGAGTGGSAGATGADAAGGAGTSGTGGSGATGTDAGPDRGDADGGGADGGKAGGCACGVAPQEDHSTSFLFALLVAITVRLRRRTTVLRTKRSSW